MWEGGGEDLLLDELLLLRPPPVRLRCLPLRSLRLGPGVGKSTTWEIFKNNNQNKAWVPSEYNAIKNSGLIFIVSCLFLLD